MLDREYGSKPVIPNLPFPNDFEKGTVLRAWPTIYRFSHNIKRLVLENPVSEMFFFLFGFQSHNEVASEATMIIYYTGFSLSIVALVIALGIFLRFK